MNILEDKYIVNRRTCTYDDIESLIDAFPGGMILTDTNGAIIDLNEPLARILLKTKEELIGAPAAIYLEETIAQSRLMKLEEVLRTKKPVTFIDYERKRWWKTTAIPVKDNKDHVLNIAGFIEDITDQKKQEQQKASDMEEYYKTIIEHSMDILTIINNEGKITYVSPSLSKLLGHDPEKRTNESMYKNIHPDDLSKLQMLFKRVKEHPNLTVNATFRVCNNEGTYRTLETIVTNELKNPLIKGLIIHARDVTDREQSRIELQNQKRYLETLMNSTSEIIFTIDSKQNIGIWNRAAEINTGIKRKDIQGKSIQTIPLFVNISELQEYIKDITLGKPVFLHQIVVKAHGYGKRLWDVSTSLVKKEGQPMGMIFVCKDITYKDESHGKLIPGMSYLISDTTLDPARDLFRSLLKQQWSGFYISRSNEKPEQLFTEITPHFAAITSNRTNDHTISNLEELHHQISTFIHSNKNVVILLDRIDYLVSLFSFHEALNTLYGLADLIKQEQGILLLRVNKLLFTPEQYAFLQEEFSKLPSKEIQYVHLQDDEFHVLEYICEQNQKNSLISQKHICQHFSISKVTAQKRLEELLTKGLIISKKQGRSKFLYVTDKGRELLQKHSIL